MALRGQTKDWSLRRVLWCWDHMDVDDGGEMYAARNETAKKSSKFDVSPNFIKILKMLCDITNKF